METRFTTKALVAAMKKEILEDIETGVVPKTVSSFGECMTTLMPTATAVCATTVSRMP